MKNISKVFKIEDEKGNTEKYAKMLTIPAIIRVSISGRRAANLAAWLSVNFINFIGWLLKAA